MQYYLNFFIPIKNEAMVYDSIHFTTKIAIDKLSKKLDKFINQCLSTKQKIDKVGRIKKNIYFENILSCNLEVPYASRSVLLKAKSFDLLEDEENNSSVDSKYVRIPYFLLENTIVEIIPIK